MRLPLPLPPRAGLPRAGLAAAALLAGCLPAGELQAREEICRAEVQSYLTELPLAEGDVKSVRIIERVNLDEFGPDILGVEGWVRLNSCSGWLVINMRPTCYILESYTRGDCRVEGLSSY